MKKIRVLVVEDSATVRNHLVEMVSAEPDMEVAGEAADGARAIELCRSLRPDVISLDVVLPKLSGLAATEYIMAHCPTPILIVSSAHSRRDLFHACDALAAGALDILEKPRGDITDATWERNFLGTLRLVSRIPVMRHIRGCHAGVAETPRFVAPRPPVVRSGRYRLVAIGASTGAPAACMEILRGLPPDFALPILLVIHTAPAFAEPLLEWFQSQSPLPVSFAADGKPLPDSGHVVMAPPGRHLVLDKEWLHVSRTPDPCAYQPSVDVLFHSIARGFPEQTIACLLTGMGRDGAKGLLAIRQGGGRTYVQDRETSAVFGMPQEAIRIGAAESVLPIQDFAPELVALSARPGNGNLAGGAGPAGDRLPCWRMPLKGR